MRFLYIFSTEKSVPHCVTKVDNEFFFVIKKVYIYSLKPGWNIGTLDRSVCNANFSIIDLIPPAHP